MWRMTDDHGAVGVMVALMMIPLLVCTAHVIDVGSAYARRTELQNAADAAALGIAQDCGKGACGNIGTTASSLTSANVAIQLGARAGGSQGPVVKSSVRTWYLSLPHLWAVAR